MPDNDRIADWFTPGDFIGDTTCTTHYGCTCLQQKAAAYDALRSKLEEEVERCRKIAGGQVGGALPIAATLFADRIQAILDETKGDQ